MKPRAWALACALLCLTLLPAFADDLRITPAGLKKLMDHDQVVVIDVRRSGHWNSSLTKIRGAVRQDPNKVQDWAKQYAHGQTIALYCA